MNNFFKDHKVRRNIVIGLFFIVFINVLSLGCWYMIRMKPILKNIEEVKTIIINDKIKNSYSTFEDLEDNIVKLTKDYDVIFKVIDEDNKIIINNDIGKISTELFDIFVKANNHIYLVQAYFPSNVTLVNLVLSLIIYQIFVTLILMILAYLFTGYSIITPIEKIINDIRNYKFGKRPYKNKIKNELGVIQNEFVNLVNSLENEKQEQKRIIASISHDIKTPLTSIIGYSALMEDNLGEKELKEYSVKVHEKALHIKDILASFDDYLVNYDNKKLNLTVVNIKDIVNQLNQDYKIELNNKNITFNINTNCANAKINIDVLKIKRVFSNIISNSIKYVPENGVITINIKKKNNFIEFVIADNGSGVEEENISKIFDPFFTTDTSRKISGLGLSICKEFIEIHGGEIEAFNNKGLTIKFTLPVYNVRAKK